ncbi:MAG: class I SAM-dependent methyltransferase, partial [bacterium]
MIQEANSNKIKVMGGKSSALFKHWTSDFNEKRYFEWQSIWFQAKEIIQRPDIHSVLEFGSGRNLTKAIVEHFGIRHLAVDVSDRFCPDVVSSIEEFFTDEKFDMVCAFEVLEHNPFEKFEALLLKMKSFSKQYVYISLPFSGRWFTIQFNVNLPKVLTRKVFS